VICSAFDVVVVPFPFTDRRASKRRPALAVSSQRFSSSSGHTLLAMITSAANPAWPLDIVIDSATAGLRSPSKVRMKVFTLDNRLILRKTGSLRESDRRAVQRAIREVLAGGFD